MQHKYICDINNQNFHHNKSVKVNFYYFKTKDVVFFPYQNVLN